MLTTKFFFGFGLILLGWFHFENSDRLSIATLENKYSSIRKVNNNKIVVQKDPMPGKEIYTDFCVQCHGANGKGDGKNFPPLDGSDFLFKKRTQSIYGLKFGQSEEIIVNKVKYKNIMPILGLSNQEVADVMNYIMNSWTNKHHKKVTVKEVEGIKQLNNPTH